MRRVVLAAVAFVGCGTQAPPAPSPAACSGRDAIVAMSDETSASELGSLALDGGVSAPPPTADLGTDPMLASSNGHAFYVNRSAGSILALDACGNALSSVLVNPPRGGSADPQDVALAPDGALWVPRFNVPQIAIVRGRAIASTVDVSSFDADGNPEASSIRIVNVGGAAKAFVALERLRHVGITLEPDPATPALMLRIDVATAQVEAQIPLAGLNPFNLIDEDGGVFYLADAGTFERADETLAGIERFDPQTSTTRLLVREVDLGGTAAEVAVSGRCGAALVADATPQVNRVSLVTFDAQTGAVLARGVLGPSVDFDEGARGLAWTDGGRVLMVGDRARATTGYPVHVFDRDDACGLHPRPDVVFVGYKPVAVRSTT